MKQEVIDKRSLEIILSDQKIEINGLAKTFRAAKRVCGFPNHAYNESATIAFITVFSKFNVSAICSMPIPV